MQAACFTASTTADIDSIVNLALEEYKVPGAAIGIVIDGQVILARGYGTCQINEQLPVTEQTTFSIGSCTKAFTALVLCQLAEEGKISLDDAVKKFVPEFDIIGSEITIRDLLSHRTGRARHDVFWFYSQRTETDLLKFLCLTKPHCGLRQEFQYNNMMYVVAGLIIESVTGKSYEKVIFERIFMPLDMENSRFDLDASLEYSRPHADINGNIQEIPFHHLNAIKPAGGIKSNIMDLLKWVSLHISKNNFLVQSEILQDMYTVHMPINIQEKDDIFTLGYGLGWFIAKYQEHDFVTHRGDIDGFSSEVSFLPNEKIGIVILTNSSSDGRYLISSLRNQIIDKIFSHKYTDWETRIQVVRDKNKRTLRQAVQAFIEIKQPSLSYSLNDYVGSYHHPAYGSLEISIKDNQLYFSYAKTTFPLKYIESNLFKVMVHELLFYDVNPIMDVRFFRNTFGEIERVEVPFESFRGFPPIVFKKNILYQ